MIVQIAGGIGMQYPRAARLASIDLGITYLLFSLACIPGIIAAPTIYAHCAIALYAATEANAARAVAFGRVARLGLGVCAISFTLSQILYLPVTADLVDNVFRWATQ